MSLFNNYITRKGRHISLGKLLRIENGDLVYLDFQGEEQRIGLQDGLKAVRKSSQNEINVARNRAQKTEFVRQ